jgi:UDP-glucose 6-dehydrogenase
VKISVIGAGYFWLKSALLVDLGLPLLFCVYTNQEKVYNSNGIDLGFVRQQEMKWIGVTQL